MEIISCKSTNVTEDSCCGTSGSDIRGIQTLCIISLGISLIGLGCIIGGGSDYILIHLGWLFTTVIIEFAMVIWVNIILSKQG